MCAVQGCEYRGEGVLQLGSVADAISYYIVTEEVPCTGISMTKACYEGLLIQVSFCDTKGL